MGRLAARKHDRRSSGALDAKLAKKQEAQRQHLQAFVDRFRAKATKARQAQSRLKMLAKLEPVAAVVAEEVAMIGGEEDQGIAVEPLGFEQGQHSPNLFVDF